MESISSAPHSWSEICALVINLLDRGAIWLPGLAAVLAENEWMALQHRSGLSRLSYGTDRVRAADQNIPRNILVEITTPQAKQLALPPIIVEHPFRSDSYYQTLELVFYGDKELAPSHVAGSLGAAFDCLSLAPDLLTAVVHLVRVIHIIRPPDPAYDVSHSDPDVPFSVFVSLPDKTDERERLRLAEALLHEAMHLQLTLLEGHAPLVQRLEAAHYSPWKKSMRPIQGVMHGLYVFGVIDAFLEMAEGAYVGRTLNYIRDRRQQIAEEVAEVAPIGLDDDLTAIGVTLRSAILARFSREGR